MITLLQQAFGIRSVVPMVLTLSLAPQTLFIWSIWRAFSAFLPRRMYECVDEKLYDICQTLVVFFFETYAGTKLIFYGDEIPWHKKENVLYLCNHQSTVDWAVVDMLAIRQNTLGYIRYILKDGLRYLPFYGFYFPQHGCIYVKRNATADMMKIQRKMMRFKRNGTPLWLVIFPEGTRYNLEKPEQQNQSQEFARSRGLSVLEHVLTPRTKATEIALDTLSDHLDAIYDLTIAYRDKNEDLLPRKKAKSLPGQSSEIGFFGVHWLPHVVTLDAQVVALTGPLEFLQEQNQEIHIHVRRLTPNRIPQDNQKRKQWIFEAFSLKDRLLSDFYSEDTDVQGRFPGPSRRRELPLKRTLPWALFWAGVLAPFVATKYGRSLYWKGWLAGSVGTVLYMSILYDKLQG